MTRSKSPRDQQALDDARALLASLGAGRATTPTQDLAAMTDDQRAERTVDSSDPTGDES